MSHFTALLTINDNFLKGGHWVGDLYFRDKHPDDAMPEEGLQLFEFEWRHHPEHSFYSSCNPYIFSLNHFTPSFTY
jgi:hypothetical protein